MRPDLQECLLTLQRPPWVRSQSRSNRLSGGPALPRAGDGTLTDCPQVPAKMRRKFKGAEEGEDPRVEGVGYSPLPQGESTCENPQYANAPRKKPNSKKWQFDPTLQNTSGLTERLD